MASTSNDTADRTPNAIVQLSDETYLQINFHWIANRDLQWLTETKEKNSWPTSQITFDHFEDFNFLGKKEGLVKFVGASNDCKRELAQLQLEKSSRTGTLDDLWKKVETMNVCMSAEINELKVENNLLKSDVIYLKKFVCPDQRETNRVPGVDGEYISGTLRWCSKKDLESALYGSDLDGLNLLIFELASTMEFKGKTWEDLAENERIFLDRLMLYLVVARVNLEIAEKGPSNGQQNESMEPTTSTSTGNQNQDSSSSTETPSKKRSRKVVVSTDVNARKKALLVAFQKSLTNAVKRKSDPLASQQPKKKMRKRKNQQINSD